ncbi:MAG: hypothetical protein H6766_04935 [Candidatus Peribacteria bacterium]|nr:MAG: hypothetical protein H6766_04935 [Candidatus Peribacteria bacterium]
MKNEVARLRKDIDEAASPEKVMEATSRFRFLHALDVFANSVDDQSLSIEDKKRALNILSKKMQYITDINITLTDGKTKAKDFLDAKLLDLAKQDGVIADEALSKDIDNFRDDLNYESHAYGLTMTVEDGVDHAEIVRSAEQVAKGDRIEYVGYLDYTENIKRLDSNRDGEKLIPGQIEKYFTSSELDLSRLSYMDSQSAERLVKAINNNPHIQSVTFNAMLMKERL